MSHNNDLQMGNIKKLIILYKLISFKYDNIRCQCLNECDGVVYMSANHHHNDFYRSTKTRFNRIE